MVYRIVVEPVPRSDYTPGFTERFDPGQHNFTVPPRSVESRARLLTMFGDVTVLDNAGEVVYSFPYRNAKDQ